MLRILRLPLVRIGFMLGLLAWQAQASGGRDALYFGGTALAVGPANSIYVAGTYIFPFYQEYFWAVLKSVDEGATWSLVDSYQLEPGRYAAAMDMEVDPEGRIFVTGNVDRKGSDDWHQVVRRSEDSGKSWKVVDNFQTAKPLSANAIALAIDSKGRLYSLSSGVAAHMIQWQVRRSQDHGETWQTIDVFSGVGFGVRPVDVATDSKGNVYVTGEVTASSNWEDTYAVVRKWDLEKQAWTTVDQFRSPEHWTWPKSIFIDPLDNVITYGRADSIHEGSERSPDFSYLRWSKDQGRSWMTRDVYLDYNQFGYFPGFLQFTPAGNWLEMGYEYCGARARCRKDWVIRQYDPSIEQWNTIETAPFADAGERRSWWPVDFKSSRGGKFYALGAVPKKEGVIGGEETPVLRKSSNGRDWDFTLIKAPGIPER